MYAGNHFAQHPERAVFIMAGSGETVTYAEHERRTNRLAHLLRAEGLRRLDHYAIFMENNARYLESNGAGERSGLYYTCINSYLTAEEAAYVIDNSRSLVLITSVAKLPVARAALARCPRVVRCLVVDGGDAVRALDDPRCVDFAEATARFPDTPIADEWLGTPMLYSSGTTGRPKGIIRPLPENPPSQPLPLFHFLNKLWQCKEGMRYLSPAPLYHAAPQANVALTVRNGGTVVIMEQFDPEQCLALIEQHRITHIQLVPTMFSRMLKLPEAVRKRYDLGSLTIAVHAAAPCPVPVKEQMIEWWGPIVHEYYGATEGLGFTACNSAEWLAHRGTVGKVLLGDLHVLDEARQPVAKGQPGELWFKTATPFEYFNDPERTQASRSADGSMTTVGDVGYLDDDGFLYLTDRSTFMIISGGVNVYPQECENLLITHPQVLDAAVFGVPNEDLGEEVKAVVQPMPGVPADEQFEQALIAFCRDHLAPMKCPRTIDFTDALPRLPTGKLYKKPLRDKYWQGRGSRIV
ncbi:MAG: AMP-binding protein [Burkholderiaceae bacterium]|nr:MAG: AMP-binding protein [Burkholderiaceae bacterium]MCC7285647.1 AMP-binding protein [Burkholderiaceae bacterium]